MQEMRSVKEMFLFFSRISVVGQALFICIFFATERTSGQFIVFSTTACQVRFKEILDYKLCLHDGDLNIEGCTVQP